MRFMMRWGLSAALGVCMIGAVLAAPVVLPHVITPQQAGDQPDSPPLTGDMAEFTPLRARVPAPPLPFTDAEGRGHNLAELRGKFVILNFWATWCGPCVEELPKLDALARAPVVANMVVATIAQDRRGAAVVVPFLTTKGLNALPRFLDADGAAGRVLNVEALPTTFLVDPEGQIIGSIDGAADWNGGDARRLIAWYAAAQPKASEQP
jgi:thiol-disulfide isomerase/thioredoxin